MHALAVYQTKVDEIPSLNGIRAVSALIVVFSHAGLERVVPGGLGVTIFFFLSGYLITTLMLREHTRSGGIDIAAFYVRRLRRLVPPLIVTLIVAYTLTFVGLLPGHITVQGVLAQLFYLANYLEIYFDGSAKIPTGTGVLWSLAVEEHFYLVFPVLMSLSFLRGMSNSRRMLIAAGICAAVLAWRCYLVYALGASESRTYFASDTRVDSIIYGCILAFWLWAEERRASDRTMNAADYGLLALGGLLLISTILYRDPQFRETFRYSLQGIALMPLFYLAVRFPKSWPFALLNHSIAVRIGIYSYAIYLIHRVIIVALVENLPWLETEPVVLTTACLTLSVIFAILVDRYVDRYFRRHHPKQRRALMAVDTTVGTPLTF
jgi:peptidoglycan/LPS O-acetylase OafA/YrhL